MEVVKRSATTKQVAEMLGVKETTVQLYSRQGRIPFAVTPGGHRRYDLREVRDAFAEVGSPGRLKPMTSSGLGEGSEATLSVMAAMDSERRAVTNSALKEDVESGESDAGGGMAAVMSLFERPRRVLVAV
ncbi:MAG: helix-turn-helix domain-containing protein [Microthrixaceae bacterium]